MGDDTYPEQSEPFVDNSTETQIKTGDTRPEQSGTNTIFLPDIDKAHNHTYINMEILKTKICKKIQDLECQSIKFIKYEDDSLPKKFKQISIEDFKIPRHLAFYIEKDGVNYIILKLDKDYKIYTEQGSIWEEYTERSINEIFSELKIEIENGKIKSSSVAPSEAPLKDPLKEIDC